MNSSGLQPAASRSSQTMFVSVGFVSLPPLLVHVSPIFLARVWHALSFPPSPQGPLPKLSSTATRAAAAMMPACRVPPPIDFRILRACLMNDTEPTMILPIGAPRPLEKHILTLSKQVVNSGRLPALAATASHI